MGSTIVFCFLGVVNIVWFARCTWVAVSESSFKGYRWRKFGVEESLRPYIFAGICLFYIGFAIVLYKLLNAKPQAAIEADELEGYCCTSRIDRPQA